MSAPRRAGLGVRLGRLVVFSAIALPVLLRLAELGSGYLTPTTGCRVTGVIDGDTVRLDCPDGGATRGRLLGFDAPEVFSPQCAAEWLKGLEATVRLRLALWSARDIETRGHDFDRYGRRLVQLRLDGRDVADTMVNAGLARRYRGGQRERWCE